MKLKLNKIAVRSFVLIMSIIYVVAGFFLGCIVTVVSLIAPNEQGLGGVGPWSILVFPIFNGVLGCFSAVFLASIYNVLAKHMGGAVFEFEDTP